MNPDRNQTGPGSNSARGEAERVRAVAAVHLASEGGSQVAWVVVGSIAGPDEPSGAGGTTEQRRFSAAEFAAIRGWLRDRGVGVVVRVAPARQVLVRMVKPPDDVRDRAALASAMELLAESELPSHLPWYRRAGGVIAGDVPAAMVIGWHGPAATSVEPDPLAAALEGVRQIWSTEAVALAWMLRSGRRDGVRWLASLNRTAGAAVLALRADDRVVMRSLRVPSTDAERWIAGINAALAELARAAGEGVTAPTLQTTELDGLVGSDLRPGGAESGAAIPAALVEAFSTADPAVRALFNLHASEPRRSEGLATAAITWFSHPVRAAAVVAACIAALLLVPLGVAYARHSALQKQAAGIEGLDERLMQAEQRAAFYALLREKRWPMSKLVADIAMSAPEGVTLDLLEINQGEAISIRGVAKSNDLVSTFRENLEKTKVFDGIATPNLGSSPDGVQFQVQARVSPTGAVYRGNVIDDFAANPLGKRMYGDAWTGESGRSVDHADADGESRDRDEPRRETSRTSSSGSESRESGSRSGSSSAPAPTIPPPLSDDDIAKLDATKAMLEFAKRKQAAGQPGLDASTKQRLLDESEKARQRMSEARKGGGA